MLVSEDIGGVTDALLPRAILWGSCLLVLGRIAIFAMLGPQALEPDTTQLVLWSSTLRECLATGMLGACGGAGHFPLFQYLPALALGAAGFEPAAIVRALAVVSFAAFLGLLMAGWRALPASREARALWLVVMGSGPLLFYAQSSFGEALAAFLVAAAVASCWNRLPAPGIAALFALAGITKEIAPPILMVLGVIAVLANEIPRARMGRSLWAVAVGSLLAVVANASFNVARFGVPYNQILLGPGMPLVPLSERPSFFLGLWFSPNGGLVFFWTSFVAVLAIVLAHSWRPAPAKIPAYGVALVLAALTYGLSGWWAPFGWIAWGPRLLLPWIPACLMILLRAYPKETLVLGQLGGAARAAIFAVIAIAGLSQFSALYGLEVIQRIFGPAPGCPSIPTDPANQAQYYFHCMRYYVWEPRIPLGRLFGAALQPPATPFALAYLVALLGWYRIAASQRRTLARRVGITPAP